MRLLHQFGGFVVAVGLAGMIFCSSCDSGKESGKPVGRPGPVVAGVGSFGDDVAFLEKHGEVIVLSDAGGGAKLAVSAAMQGRVFTSTADGDGGMSFGWINRELIASGENNPHINAFGGEDRFWLGPEGGQFSIFFKKGDTFDLAHWYTPAAVNEEAFEVTLQKKDQVVFAKSMQLKNYSGAEFKLDLERKVILLPADQIAELFGVVPGESVKTVGYQSVNKITNSGQEAWKKETGLLSVWILGMFSPSPATTVVVPFVGGEEQELGPIVNDSYFGKVPADRLKVKGSTIYFSGDGKFRSKIGLTPSRAKAVLGSYDAASQALTIVQYSKPEGVTDYVNSMWEIQEKPFAGDVVNSYNDGPSEPGAKPMGPFYELETSSAAAALEPGGSLTHIHRTFHFQGDKAELDKITQKVLGVTIDEIENGLK